MAVKRARMCSKCGNHQTKFKSKNEKTGEDVYMCRNCRPQTSK